MKGVDYAFRNSYNAPSMSALQAAGVRFVGRYISQMAANDSNGKNLIPSEKGRILGAGLAIILYCEESTPGFMKGGRSAATPIAQHAVAVANALGMPHIPFFYACDFDASPGDQAAINAFLDGAAAVHGLDRTGLYGGYYPVKRAFDAGKIRYACQTWAWSACSADFVPPHGTDKVNVGGSWRLFDERAQVRQTVIIKIDGVECDLLESRAVDYGQWPRPAAPPVHVPTVTPTPTAITEEEMPNGVVSGTSGVTPVSFKKGSVRKVVFYAAGTGSVNLQIAHADSVFDAGTITAAPHGEYDIKFPDDVSAIILSKASGTISWHTE